MKRRRSFPALAVLIAVGVASCGGGTKTVTVTTPAPPALGAPATSVHPCTATQFYMQCALPEPPLTLKLGGTTSAYGVDFGWQNVSASQARAIGAKFGASYLSNSTKDWSLSLIRSYHSLGLATVFVRETSATRALDGCPAGIADAQASVAELRALGEPANQPFTMAIDFDASGPDVASYFRCASQTAPGRVNAYGGYVPLQYLCAHGLVGHFNWQTYAWSRGLFLPASCAPLEQYLNGNNFDNDRAIAVNYGQDPPAQTGPTQGQLSRWRSARNFSFSAYHKHRCTLGQASPGKACELFAHRVVYFQERLWTGAPKWGCFGRHARKHSFVCWIVRPEVSHWSHLRDAAQRKYELDVCRGATGTEALTPYCRRLQNTAGHYQRLIKEAEAL
jgi:hypothetical protein